jgi:phenylpropionate dioxygenase-like ring-hydroxylating dioxygenase large terminal subunit
MPKPSLRNYWHPVAAAAEISDQPKAFTLLGERLVVFRDNEGPVVFKDLCIHRGAALSRGTVCDGAIVCAYHGWRYARTGECVHIPSLPAGARIPEKARAIAHAAREAFGLVWACLDTPTSSLLKNPWPRR